MISYRMYLRTRKDIVERRDFEAENDELAASAAATVFEACSDRCDGWDLWDGARRVANQHTTKQLLAWAQTARAETRAIIEEIACSIEEVIVTANGQVARSPNMRAKFDALRGKLQSRRG